MIRWRDTLDRCYNPNDPGFKNYGGRDIQVFPPWRKSFVAYRDYIRSIGFTGAPGQTVDRIDNNGNYEPGNLRVANWKTQQRNRRNNRVISAFGVTACVSDWAEHLGVLRSRIYGRLRAGWLPERALTEPLRGSTH